MTHWNSQLSNLETLDKNVDGGRVFAGKAFEELDRDRTSHHISLLLLIRGLIATWLILGAWSVYTNHTKVSPKSEDIHGGYSQWFR